MEDDVALRLSYFPLLACMITCLALCSQTLYIKAPSSTMEVVELIFFFTSD